MIRAYFRFQVQNSVIVHREIAKVLSNIMYARVHSVKAPLEALLVIVFRQVRECHIESFKSFNV